MFSSGLMLTAGTLLGAGPLLLHAAPAQALPAAAELIPASPEAAWSGSYLLNHVFVAEYQLLWKHPAPDSTEPVPVDRELLLQPYGQASFRRATFALAAMRARSQNYPEEKLLDQRLAAHLAMLKSTDFVIDEQVKLLQAAAALQPGSGDNGAAMAAAKGFDLIVNSFAGPEQQQRMKDLLGLYFADAPSCPISADEVEMFATHQQALQSANGTAGTGSLNGGQLVAPLREWSFKKVRCLVFALMGTSAEAKEKAGTDPVHLMLTLQQTASPLAKDASYKSVFAIRLLQTRQFAETLRVLIELVDLQPGFRLPYEMVQRIFSVSQKGDGQVALKGI
jgi:hypothetical protein